MACSERAICSWSTLIFSSRTNFWSKAAFLELESLSSWDWSSACSSLRLAAWDLRSLISSWVTAWAAGRAEDMTNRSMTSVMSHATSRFPRSLELRICCIVASPHYVFFRGFPMLTGAVYHTPSKIARRKQKFNKRVTRSFPPPDCVPEAVPRAEKGFFPPYCGAGTLAPQHRVVPCTRVHRSSSLLYLEFSPIARPSQGVIGGHFPPEGGKNPGPGPKPGPAPPGP